MQSQFNGLFQKSKVINHTDLNSLLLKDNTLLPDTDKPHKVFLSLYFYTSTKCVIRQNIRYKLLLSLLQQTV